MCRVSKSRLIDASLVTSGTIQASVLDIPNIILEDLLENPIPTMIGIFTLILIIVRIARIIQKMHYRK